MTITIDIDDETRQRLEAESRFAGKALENYIAELIKTPTWGPSSRTGRRELGWAKGMIKMSDDFDAPLDEFKEYM